MPVGKNSSTVYLLECVLLLHKIENTDMRDESAHSRNVFGVCVRFLDDVIRCGAFTPGHSAAAVRGNKKNLFTKWEN